MGIYIGWDGREYEDAELDNMREREPEPTREEEQRRAAGRKYSELHEHIKRATESHYRWEDSGEEGPDPLAVLQDALSLAIEEVKEVRKHQHIWNEDDYCTVCGRDGRA